jgi:hypothetical protein
MQYEPPKYNGIGLGEMIVGFIVCACIFGILISLCFRGR